MKDFLNQMKEAFKKAGSILGNAAMKIIRVPSNYRKVDNKVGDFLVNNCGPLGKPINFLRKFIIPTLILGPLAGPITYLLYRFVAKPVVQAVWALVKQVAQAVAGLAKGIVVGTYHAIQKGMDRSKAKEKDEVDLDNAEINKDEITSKDKNDIELKKYRETKLVEKYDVEKMINLSKTPEKSSEPRIQPALNRLGAILSTVAQKNNGNLTPEATKEIFNGMDGNNNRVFDISNVDPSKGYLKDEKFSCKIQFMGDNQYKVLRISPIKTSMELQGQEQVAGEQVKEVKPTEKQGIKAAPTTIETMHSTENLSDNEKALLNSYDNRLQEIIDGKNQRVEASKQNLDEFTPEEKAEINSLVSAKADVWENNIQQRKDAIRQETAAVKQTITAEANAKANKFSIEGLGAKQGEVATAPVNHREHVKQKGLAL